MSIFWNKNFINNFISSKNDKKVSTLLWKEQDEDIYAQLVDCIENKSDIILSEILPNELPSGTTLLEYKYFINKFMFCPPHVFPKKENISQAKAYKKIVIFDENYKLLRFSLRNNYRNCMDLQIRKKEMIISPY